MLDHPGFIVAVDQQPVDLMAQWRGLGVNTLVGIPQGHDPVAWCAMADELGLYQIRPIVGDPAVDSGNPLLLAWLHQDEPELHMMTEANLFAARMQAAGQALAREIPWMMNVDGSRVLDLQPGNSPHLLMADYQKLMRQAHWISTDVYPVTGWNLAIPLDSTGRAIDRVRHWAPGKPRLAYVECSDQRLPWVPGHRCATPAEFRAQLDDVFRRDSRGVILAPWSGPNAPPFKFDDMPLALKDELQIFTNHLGLLRDQARAQALQI